MDMYSSKKNHFEIKLCSDKDAKHPLDLDKTNKQFEEEILFERAVKTIIEISFDKRLFVRYYYADRILKYYLPIEMKERSKPSLDQ